VSALPHAPNAARLRGWSFWVLPMVALALIVGWEIDWGRQIVRVPSAPAPAEPKPVTASALPDYQIEGGLEAHAETVQRTLFNATRRPAPPLSAENGPRQIAHGKFLLTGTTVTEGRNVAFLKEVNGGKTHVVRQGDELDGMKVALVTTDRVRFAAGSDTEELILKVASGPKTTIAAAPPGAPGQGARPAGAQPGARGVVRPAQQVPGTATPSPAQTARGARRAARTPGGQQQSDAGAQDQGNNPQTGTWGAAFRNMQRQGAGQ
jgi:hypothetical protein